MWQISKNLANFALGFFVLLEIIKFAFFAQEDSVKKVFDVLKWALIAGIGIQASWLLLAIVIDISTILIVALGWLPLTLMSNLEMGNQPVLGVQGYLNLSDTSNSQSNKVDNLVYYKWGDHTFAPCRITEWVVVGSIYTWNVNEKLDFSQNGQKKQYCMLWQQNLVDITAMKYRSDLAADAVKQLKKYRLLTETKDSDPDSLKDSDNTFLSLMDDSQNDFGGQNGLDYYSERADGAVDTLKNRERITGNNGKILNLHEGGIGIDWKEEFKDTEEWGVGTFMSDIMEDSTTFVGPMVTLYVTLLEFSNLHTTAIGGGEAESGMAFFFEFMLKALIGLMLIVPLIVLAVVLIMRIGILWVVIAFSPFLALLRWFGKQDWLSKTKFTTTNIIWIIFSPVLPIFVLGLSIIFLQALSQRFYDPANQGSRESFGITIQHDEKEQMSCATIWGAMDFCYESQSDDSGGSIYANLFAWLLVNIFAIGLIWSLIKLSFKWNDFTSGVVNSIVKTAGTVAWSIPIVPLPWSGAGGGLGFVWWNAFSQATGIGKRGPWILGNRVNDYFRKVQNNQIKNLRGIQDDENSKEQFAAREASYWNNVSAWGANAQGLLQETGALAQGENIRQAYQNVNVWDYSDRGQKIILEGFGGEITAIRDNLWSTPTIAQLQEARTLMNSSIGKTYREKNNNINPFKSSYVINGVSYNFAPDADGNYPAITPPATPQNATPAAWTSITSTNPATTPNQTTNPTGTPPSGWTPSPTGNS